MAGRSIAVCNFFDNALLSGLFSCYALKLPAESTDEEMGAPSRAEQFITACITLPYPEVRDTRGEESVPELTYLAARLDAGLGMDAIEYGRGLLRHFPDNDVVANVIGTLLVDQDQVHEVTDLMRQALATCPRKYRLYAMAGEAELVRNRLANACVWWSRSVIAQCEVRDYQAYLPFYYLAHAAIVLDAVHEAEAFFEMAATIEPNAPRFSPALEEGLDPVREHWIAGPLFQVIQYIDSTYLVHEG